MQKLHFKNDTGKNVKLKNQEPGMDPNVSQECLDVDDKVNKQ